MRILIAEDDKVSQKILINTVEQWGHTALVANNGNEAWEILQGDNAPQIAIMDWCMDGLTGLEVCEKLRDEDNEMYTYVILLTAKDNKEDMLEGLSAGADDYLTKPFHPTELNLRLEAGLRVVSLQHRLNFSLHELQKTEHQRTEFISALTHDMRTPLIAEQRALEVINTFDNEMDDHTKSLLGSMANNNDDLLSLVNQLLDGFQADDMKMDIDPNETNVNALVNDSLASVLTLATNKNITLNYTPSNEPLPDVSIDGLQVKRVLVNLISNAISHIPEESTVTVSAATELDRLIIQVSDNGPGIEAGLLPHLFERYAQENKVGHGLGLSICKTIIELHDGTITASNQPDGGACFTLCLPIKKASITTHQTLRVVIAEDQELARIGLEFALKGCDNIEVVGTAENGDQALSLIAKLKPDVVLMDMVMPSMNGIEATVRTKKDFEETKIIFLTSQTDPNKVKTALAAGADGYCVKDIKTHKLVDVMHTVMDGNRWLDPAIARYIESTFPEDLPKLNPASIPNHLQLGSYDLPADLEYRELETLRLIASNRKVADIATIFHTTIDCVNDYLSSAMNKLAVDNYREAAKKAKETGLLTQGRC